MVTNKINQNPGIKKDLLGEEQPNATADGAIGNMNQIDEDETVSSVTLDDCLFAHEYKYPSIDFLCPDSNNISVGDDEQTENKEIIRQKLLVFGVPITNIEATTGPTITFYEVCPDSGVKSTKISKIVDDIENELSLSFNSRVRVILPIPGKGAMGIEVPKKKKSIVTMKSILNSKTYQKATMELPCALGKTVNNDVYMFDLAKTPHILVAGATGQGKTVALNVIITSLLYCKRPEELKFVMIDPKCVEFNIYRPIENHFLAKSKEDTSPIITDVQEAVKTLNSLCALMDSRYEMLKKAKVRNIKAFNEKFKKNELNTENGYEFMPYIVVIIDEFVDLKIIAGKEIELPICRIAQLAHVVGIHVIIATQRPTYNIISGTIKANFPTRVAFSVISKIDSRTILDQSGAQQLTGNGDMLYMQGHDLVRLQCAFVDTPEIEKICNYIACQPYPQGTYILPDPQD